MKKIIALLLVLVIGLSIWFWFRLAPSVITRVNQEELLLTTYRLSKQYSVLRYRTDKILTEAKGLGDFNTWQLEVEKVLKDWLQLSTEADALAVQAQLMVNDSIAWRLIPVARAYDRQEISQVFDSAPAGRKIATLAKHLGVDAKRAMQILQQDQAQVTADAWNEAGDKLQALETSAVVIKDSAKVTVFVGTVVATGGAAGFAAGSAITKGSIIVSGADLILEVTDDAAKIGLGNHNKISSITGQVRQVTEPLAGLLAVADIPDNITKGIEKLSAVTFGAEQFNGVVQEGKIIGVELPAAKKVEKFQNIKKYKSPVYISQLETTEVDTWIKDRVVDPIKDDEQSVQATLGLGQSFELQVNNSPQADSNSELVDSSEPVSDSKTEPIVSDLVIMNQIKLEPIKQEIGNDWQGALRISLFNNAPIIIEDGVFEAVHRDSYSFGEFTGTGEIKLKGSYDPKTGIIKGSHYRQYNGTYKKEPRTIVYSGSFEAMLATDVSEIKINFNGQITTTRTDGRGKLYSTTDQGGSSYSYRIIKK